MSADELRAAAAVMVAAADGAEIEWQHLDCAPKDEWRRGAGGNCGWNWSTYRYRVKPKPREFWLRLSARATFEGFYENEESARRGVEQHPGSVLLHAYEVLP